MSDNRIARVWTSIAACARREGAPVSLRHVCVACAAAVDAEGATITFSGGGNAVPGVLLSSRPSFDEVEELQVSLGEGPGVEAMRGLGPVLVDDLASLESSGRWPAFAPAAVALGVRAMFAFPIQTGAARIGVLNIYRSTNLPLLGSELADALAYASSALVMALDQRGGIIPDMDDPQNDASPHWRTEVHQATGMVSVQLGVGMADALASMRAYSYSNGRRLSDVAVDVVARRLRFEPDGPLATDSRDNETDRSAQTGTPREDEER